MTILGLTGSIGMGKSTTARMFAEQGVPVHDADAAVHALYEQPHVIAAIEVLFPGTTESHGVDRKKLSRFVLNDAENMQRLEELVHPMVRQAERAFLEEARERGSPLVVLDIPLLFETKADQRVDKILVVTAPGAVQRERVLSRPNMTPERFENILAKQIPDAEKRARADFIIDTSNGMDHARAEVKKIIDTLTSETAG